MADFDPAEGSIWPTGRPLFQVFTRLTRTPGMAWTPADRPQSIEGARALARLTNLRPDCEARIFRVRFGEEQF